LILLIAELATIPLSYFRFLFGLRRSLL
jgi:hypothetical protein